jgi:hypothetical protein
MAEGISLRESGFSINSVADSQRVVDAILDPYPLKIFLPIQISIRFRFCSGGDPDLVKDHVYPDPALIKMEKIVQRFSFNIMKTTVPSVPIYRHNYLQTGIL